MRIWHPELIEILDNKRLNGQHREIHGLITVCNKIMSGEYGNKRVPWESNPMVSWFLSSICYYDWGVEYHNKLVKEMERRDFNHKSPIEFMYSPPLIRTHSVINEAYLSMDIMSLVQKWKEEHKVLDEMRFNYVNNRVIIRLQEDWYPGMDYDESKRIRITYNYSSIHV